MCLGDSSCSQQSKCWWQEMYTHACSLARFPSPFSFFFAFAPCQSNMIGRWIWTSCNRHFLKADIALGNSLLGRNRKKGEKRRKKKRKEKRRERECVWERERERERREKLRMMGWTWMKVEHPSSLFMGFTHADILCIHASTSPQTTHLTNTALIPLSVANTIKNWELLHNSHV